MSTPPNHKTTPPSHKSSSPSRKRTDMACVNCRARKIKCESNKPQPCRHCKERGKDCSYVPVAEDARHSPPAHQLPPFNPGSSSIITFSTNNSSQYHSEPYEASYASINGYAEAQSPPDQTYNYAEQYQSSSSYSTLVPVPGYASYPTHEAQTYPSAGPEIPTGLPHPAELSVGLAVPVMNDHGHFGTAQTSNIQNTYVDQATYGFISQSSSGTSTPRYQSSQDQYHASSSSYAQPASSDPYSISYSAYYDNRGGFN